MNKKTPELHVIPIEQLDVWEDANVRKMNVLLRIDELAGNIKQHGVQSPLLVKEKEKNKKYFIFSGQRRYEASKIAGIESIPCLVYKNISLTQAKILSFSENMYRADMTMEDKSHATRELFTKLKKMERVAKVLGVKNVQTVKRYLRYDDIPEELKKYGRKPHGDLSANEVEDIYFNYPDQTRAVNIAKMLASIKKSTIKRQKTHASIKMAVASDDITAITKRANKLIHVQTFKIVLLDTRSKTLEKVASARKISIEDFIVNIVESWIDGYLSGRGHE